MSIQLVRITFFNIFLVLKGNKCRFVVDPRNENATEWREQIVNVLCLPAGWEFNVEDIVSLGLLC